MEGGQRPGVGGQPRAAVERVVEDAQPVVGEGEPFVGVPPPGRRNGSVVSRRRQNPCSWRKFGPKSTAVSKSFVDGKAASFMVTVTTQ